MKFLSKMGIGSAQFGMNYGIANPSGEVREDDIVQILSLAESKNIRLIDTAALYGNSESRLGRHLSPSFNVVTKIAVGDWAGQLEASLGRLQMESCYGLLHHRAEELQGPQGPAVFAQMENLKNLGKVKKIGISCYDPQQALELSETYPLDLIQFPLNILDQRFVPILGTLKTRGLELHVRSVFLQGLLLMEELAPYFSSLRSRLDQFREECRESGHTIRQGLMGFPLTFPEVDFVILGFDSFLQFEQVIGEVEAFDETKKINYLRYRCDDLKTINANLWPKNSQDLHP